MNRAITWLCLLILFTGCAPRVATLTPTSLPSTASEAQTALIKFFELLNSKQYADADTLYGGDYEQLKVFSSDTDPSDHAKLWAVRVNLPGYNAWKFVLPHLKTCKATRTSFK